MNSIFKLIAFPITLVIGIISAMCVIALNLEEIGFVKDGKLTKGELAKKLSLEFNHFLLYEQWIEIFPFARMLIALVIYYLIIF